MNILFIIPNLEIGGAQSFLLRLASAMAEENHHVVLFNVHPRQVNTGFYKYLLSEKVKIYHAKAEDIEQKLDNSRFPYLARLFKRFYFKIKSRANRNKTQLNSIIKKHQIEVINSHMYLADLFIYNFKNKISGKVKWITSFHGCYNLLLDKNPQKTGLHSHLQNILLKTDGIILAAERHHKVLEKLKLKTMPARKIYYGFTSGAYQKTNLREKHQIPNSAVVFGMVARGDQTKGWLEAIDAFCSLPEENNAYLVLTGDGNYLKDLSNQYKTSERIIFTGPTDKPLSIIEHFDVGLLPTYYPAESLPNSIIEYLYCHKPVIATKWAEIPQMIDAEEGLAGQLINIKNGKADVEELNKAMNNYLQNPGLMNQHKKYAAKAFEKFEMKNCISGYVNFFKECFNAQ